MKSKLWGVILIKSRETEAIELEKNTNEHKTRLYDFCPVWSRVLIFTHCPIKLIYLWLLIYEV
jgi:hypothetical protein